MSQQSKLRQSRQQWKQKAKERAAHNRYLRKELERLRKERDRATQALQEANKQLASFLRQEGEYSTGEKHA